MTKKSMMTIKEGLNKGRNDGRVSDKGARKDEGSGGASQKGRSLFSALFSSLYCQALLYVEKNNLPQSLTLFFLYVCEVSLKIKKKSGSYFNATWNIQISIIPSYGHVKFSVLASLLVFFDDTKDNDGANDDETQNFGMQSVVLLKPEGE